MTGRRHWNEPVLAPTAVKRQHYVPQCFLMPFADPDGRIRVVDFAPPGCEYRTSPLNAAVKGRFYDVEIGGEVLSAEGWLSQLEGDVTPLLQRLVSEPEQIRGLTAAEEMTLARFLAAFRFRTPTFHDEMKSLDETMIASVKKMARAYLENNYRTAEADRIWEEWSARPDEWWLSNAAHGPPAETTVQMLSGVQGFANLLYAMPWRIGRVPDERPLYTSDNPLSGYLRPVRPWWETAAFGSLQYFVPLSPAVLLRIDRLPDREEGAPLEPRGPRVADDFDAWKAGFALNVISANARRYAYGEARVVPRDNAIQWLQHIDGATLAFAMVFLGHDPRPPRLSDGPNGEPRYAGPR